jgi:hypothetical protein
MKPVAGAWHLPKEGTTRTIARLLVSAFAKRHAGARLRLHENIGVVSYSTAACAGARGFADHAVARSLSTTSAPATAPGRTIRTALVFVPACRAAPFDHGVASRILATNDSPAESHTEEGGGVWICIGEWLRFDAAATTNRSVSSLRHVRWELFPGTRPDGSPRRQERRAFPVLERRDHEPRRTVGGTSVRCALYFNQQVGQRHSATYVPFVWTRRTTRQPKRILRSVEESGSSPELGGGLIPHPQQTGNW